jgi:hypothetical protein
MDGIPDILQDILLLSKMPYQEYLRIAMGER